MWLLRSYNAFSHSSLEKEQERKDLVLGLSSYGCNLSWWRLLGEEKFILTLSRKKGWHPVLKSKLEKIAEIGDRLVGNCAEQHAANIYMNQLNENNLAHLHFSIARRRRTKEEVPYCNNCKRTFPNLWNTIRTICLPMILIGSASSMGCTCMLLLLVVLSQRL